MAPVGWTLVRGVVAPVALEIRVSCNSPACCGKPQKIRSFAAGRKVDFVFSVPLASKSNRIPMQGRREDPETRNSILPSTTRS